MDLKNELKLTGIYKFTIVDISKPKVRDEYNKILENNDISAIQEFNRQFKTREYEFKNIIPTVARQMIANNLTNTSPTNVMLINYTSLGTGTTAVSNDDTLLDTETYRKAIASRTNDENVCYLTAFYTATECNGTYYEAGLFSNATATLDTGVLFSRVLLNSPSGITKSNTETLTLDYILTIT